MPGPVPKQDGQRRRRNAPLANTRVLPSEGREGEPPAWPYPLQSKVEAEIWAELWTKPQAVAWEDTHSTRTIARYARLLAICEEHMKPVDLAEARQMEDRLGLTPMSMLRLRWEIAPRQERKLATVSDIKEAPKPQRRLILGGEDS